MIRRPVPVKTVPAASSSTPSPENYTEVVGKYGIHPAVVTLKLTTLGEWNMTHPEHQVNNLDYEGDAIRIYNLFKEHLPYRTLRELASRLKKDL